ncbi:MAG: hypothetical protein EBU62_00185 [Proteobacteria bacterium]|nr:hypothetical protein [Pseudomonadota bacterium]
MFSTDTAAVLKQCRAIEPAQSVLVLAEMPRYPIEDDTDTVLVEVIDEEPEVVWCSVPCGWRKVASDLVAPGFIERVFGHGKQFNVGVAEVLQVRSQLTGEFTVPKGKLRGFR